MGRIWIDRTDGTMTREELTGVFSDPVAEMNLAGFDHEDLTHIPSTAESFCDHVKAMLYRSGKGVGK